MHIIMHLVQHTKTHKEVLLHGKLRFPRSKTNTQMSRTKWVKSTNFIEREKNEENWRFFLFVLFLFGWYPRQIRMEELCIGMVRYKSMKNINLDLQSTCKCYGIYKLYNGSHLACTNVQIKVEHWKTYLDGIYLMRIDLMKTRVQKGLFNDQFAIYNEYDALTHQIWTVDHRL